MTTSTGISDLINGLYPISGLINGLYPISGLILLQQYHLQWRLSSVCTVMLVHFPSYPSSLVSSSYTQLYSHTVTLSYKLYFRTHIHTFMHTHHIHKYHSDMIALVTQSLVWLYLFNSVLTQTANDSFFIETGCNYLSFYQKCHPKCIWSRDVTNQTCFKWQVLQTNNL